MADDVLGDKCRDNVPALTRKTDLVDMDDVL